MIILSVTLYICVCVCVCVCVCNNDLSTARLQDADSHGHSSHFSANQQFVHSVPFHKAQYQSATNICQFYVRNEVV
jgi:hypothetical protein